MKFKMALLLVVFTIATCSNNKKVELKNNHICLELGTNDNGIPFISRGYWTETGKVVFSNATEYKITDWLPVNISAQNEIDIIENNNLWKIQKDSKFIKATAAKTLGPIKITWVVELARENSLFRSYVQLSNEGEQDVPIEWFPVWMANWDFESEENNKLRYWQPLSYEPGEMVLEDNNQMVLHSKTYSSDNHDQTGQVPFWKIDKKNGPMYFSLAWCGGWQAEIGKGEKGTKFKVILPEEETQLIFKPGEKISGPMLYMCPGKETDPELARSDWLQQREEMASTLFKKPQNQYPFIYNHWYSVRFDLSGQFIKDQVEALLPYQFDAFVVDAGWYNSVGDWTPDRKKFNKGEFENALKYVKENGISVGIWSCPWLLEVKDNQFPLQIDEPHFYRKFMNAYGLDLAGYDYNGYLYDHIDLLTKDYYMDWWKYDQEFVGETSRHGKMKKMQALQDALTHVRQSFPDLYIEDCMSGGRMINEFTDQISQIHWIRDGSRNGLAHARSNIKEALGAIQLLAPSKVERWTNRPDELDEKDKELMKLYCRSAMIGVWGVSADMAKMSARKKEIILNEIENYKQLNELKSSLLYDVIYPEKDSDIAGVVFYGNDGHKAGLLLYRWNKKGDVFAKFKFPFLKEGNYRLVNCDSVEEKNYSSDLLKRGQCEFGLNKGQLSTIYFLEKED